MTDERSSLGSVIVLVDPDRFDATVEAVTSTGLLVTSLQPAIGVVIGTIAGGTISALASIDGVESVEPNRTVHAQQSTPC